MSNEQEILVETSDVDEQEDFDAEEPSYWSAACSALRHGYDSLGNASVASDVEGSSGLTTKTATEWSIEGVNSLAHRTSRSMSISPRKRRKLTHSEVSDTSSIAPAPLSNTLILSRPYVDSFNMPASTPPISSSIVHTPMSPPRDVFGDEKESQLGFKHADDGSQDPLNLLSQEAMPFPSSQIKYLYGREDFNSDIEVSPRTDVTEHGLLSGDDGKVPRRSISVDSFRSITPSEERATTLWSPNPHPLPIVGYSPGLFTTPTPRKTFSEQRQFLLESSPLTPPPLGQRQTRHFSFPARPSSPDLASPSRSRSHSPLPGSRAPSPAHLNRQALQTESLTLEDALALQAAQSGRYSLRTRQARQLNPYAYDKALYKKMMRSNPEAIVKIVSPQQGEKRHRRKGGEETQEDWILHGDEDDGGSPKSWSRRNHMRSHDKQAEDQRGLTHQNGSSKWYPSALYDALSDEEDGYGDFPHMLPIPNHPQPESQNVPEGEIVASVKTLKQKRFPLPRKFLQDHSKSRSKEVDTSKSARHIPSSTDSAQTGARPSRHVLDHQGSSPSRAQSGPVFWENDGPNFDFDHEDHRAGLVELSDLPYDQAASLGKDADSGSIPGSPTSPIVVSDEDHLHDSRTHVRPVSVSSGSSDVEKLTAKDRKRLKALRRMLPAAMITRQLKKSQNEPEKRKRAVSTSSRESDEEDTPLLPGQSRVRMASRPPKDVHDVRGDSESSEPEGDQASESDTGAPNDLEADDDSDVLDAPDTEDDGADSHALNDGEIEAWLDEEHVRIDRDRPRGGDLIDRMLSRTRTGGAQRNRQAQNSTNRGPRRPTLRIITTGARKHGIERQTLLSFPRDDHHRDAHNRTSQGSSSRHPSAEIPADATFHHDDANVHMFTVNNTKSKPKKRHGRLIQGRLYVNSVSGRRIESGRRRHVMTIDLEDDGFHEALAPLQGDSVSTARLKQHPKQRLRDGLIHEYFTDASLTNDLPNPELVLTSTSVWDRHNAPSNVIRDITADFDIPLLPSGISFGPNTFIAKGWLHELVTHVAGSADIVPPSAYSAFGLDLAPTMSAAEFVNCFPTLCDHAYSYATLPPSTTDADATYKQWESIFRVSCQLVSWLPANSSDDDYALMRTVVEDNTVRLIGRIEDSLNVLSSTRALDFRAFTLYWFAVEISARLLCTLRARDMTLQSTIFGKFILILSRRLYKYGLRRSLEPILAHDTGIDRLTTSQFTAQLWIALLHLVNACQSNFPSADVGAEAHPFWRIVYQVIQEDHQGSMSDLEASESIWRVIFSLSALSQFSVHGMTTSSPRLPASWTLVTVALKRIRLVAEPDVDHRLSSRTIYKRDGYVRLVISRCFLLGKVWHWRFDNASVLFTQLVEIFRSRKFANLRGEVSDFPRFMRLADFSLLSEYKSKDTAFAIFLKLIVQASKDMGADPDLHPVPPKLKRLLSLMVPVGSVPFTKSTPPTGAELSMLYNRLSAVAVAILLEPTLANARTRVAQARRFVTFIDTDLATRQACIRGMMHLTILFHSLRLRLDDTLSWLSEMTNDLVDEYREFSVPSTKPGASPVSPSRDRVLISIQLLIGSVRHIIETPTINRTAQEKLEYPDPALLEGPWVTKIFSTSTNLTNSARTCVELQRLVQAFLDARAAVMPPPRRPPLAPLPLDEAESQDEYGQMDLDLDDPELLAALGGQTEPIPVSENTIKDERVAKIINAHICPAIYRLVLKHCNVPSMQGSIDDYCYDADKWIDCWVGCANVLIQNGLREWSLYITLGPQSWDRISDSTWRRRVGLRFMFMVLRLDPLAYKTYQETFLQVWLESMVTAKVTIEHDYTSLLFSIDGLRHPILHGVPCTLQGNETDYSISKTEFQAKRLQILKVLFQNLSSSLDRQVVGELHTQAQNQQWIGFVLVMLSTMRDILQGYTEDSDDRDAQTRLTELVGWGSSL